MEEGFREDVGEEGRRGDVGEDEGILGDAGDAGRRDEEEEGWLDCDLVGDEEA